MQVFRRMKAGGLSDATEAWRVNCLTAQMKDQQNDLSEGFARRKAHLETELKAAHAEALGASDSARADALAKMQAEAEQEIEELKRQQESAQREARRTIALRQLKLTMTRLMKGKGAVCVMTWRTKVLDEATERATQKRLQAYSYICIAVLISVNVVYFGEPVQHVRLVPACHAQ